MAPVLQETFLRAGLRRGVVMCTAFAAHMAAALDAIHGPAPDHPDGLFA